MSHSLLYALMLVRAAHRAAVDLTVRDITVWFRRWCGRAPYPAGWLVERVL